MHMIVEEIFQAENESEVLVNQSADYEHESSEEGFERTSAEENEMEHPKRGILSYMEESKQVLEKCEHFKLRNEIIEHSWNYR
jgi:hypothetical protein